MKLLQINLHHCKAASAALLLKIEADNVDVVLIQEPWISNERILGLRTSNYNLFQVKGKGKCRACILAKRNLNIFMLPNYSDADVVAVSLEGAKNLWFISAYLPYEEEYIPPVMLGGAIEEAQRKKIGAILGCDANAHHTIWGSTDTNNRGELFLDYILSTNLTICNVGCKPTFVTRNRQEVLDITLVSVFAKDIVMNWKVLDDHSFSDHCYIQFDVVTKAIRKEPYRNRRKTDWDFLRISLRNSLSGPVPGPLESELELDDVVNKLSVAFREAIASACPIRRSTGRSRPPWWTKDLQSTRQRCKKLFKIAKRTKASMDWDRYKETLRIYKYEIRSAKTGAWRLYCNKIQETSEAARLRKILSTSPSSPDYLQRSDGSWTTTSSESLELLLETHFPGCSIRKPERTELHLFEGAGKIIDRNKILLAIDSFKPYKSAGPDGIIPADIQQTVDIVIPWLEIIFKGSLELCYIPKMWREVKVVFIPKAGKSGHCNPKDLRPISLSSVLLKILERQIEAHLRLSIDKKMSKSQHAYRKGRGVESALHSLISPIEKSLKYKEYSLVAFLDIEGAFNNVETEAISRALASLGVENSLRCWIDQMLKSRIVTAQLGVSSISRFVNGGTPQGGVLSPLLWNVVINDLLLDLRRLGFWVVAYADDVAIAVFGKYANTLKERMQIALNTLSEWATGCGLNVNPHKTELILFSRKYKPTQIDPPTLNGIGLTFSDRAKYLGLIIDSKLSWKPNIEERARKATVALYACKNAIGKSWGMEPRIVHWLYTSVIRPILLYGIAVWWPVLDTMTNLKPMMKVQRTASLCMSGALRSTPTQALEVLFHLTPLDILGKQLAANTAIRLRSSSLWTCGDIGHSSILNNYNSITETDYTITMAPPEIRFLTDICPREEWRSKVVLNPEEVNFFTDGSKRDGKVGCGVFCEALNVNLSFRLPDYCSVFQAELTAIMAAVNWLRYNVISVRDIRIFTDSQAAIKVLHSYNLKSKVAQNCLASINEMAEQFNFRVSWVPGHFCVTGNEKADALARIGTSGTIAPSEQNICRPLVSCKAMIQETAYRLMDDRWSGGNSCVITRMIWPRVNLTKTKRLLSLRRWQIGIVVGVVTGHCLIGKHAERLGSKPRDYCRSCEDVEEEETVLHLLCTCSGLASIRRKFLGAPILNDLTDLTECDVRDILSFVKSSKWFE